jgi:predicted CoA-binding protein
MLFRSKKSTPPGKMLVLGAAENPDRFSCKAVKSLDKNGFDVVAVGFRAGFIRDIEILTGKPEISDVDTVLLYLGAKKQAEYYDYILSLKPRRVIFNPGAENPELQDILKENGIDVVKDCALIMINTGAF